MQRWASRRTPGGAVLLRTGALMSLASLGTAGLVVCGALAVGGGPSGAGLTDAFGRGPAAPAAAQAAQPAVLAAPSGRRPAPGPDRLRARPGAAPDGFSATRLTTVGAASLSGTTSSAARTPADLDSLARPARGAGVSASAVQSRSASPVLPAAAPPGGVGAVRVVPAAGAVVASAVPPALRPTVPATPAARAAEVVAKAPKAPQAPASVEAPEVAKASKASKVAEVAEVAEVAKAPESARASNAADPPRPPGPQKPPKPHHKAERAAQTAPQAPDARPAEEPAQAPAQHAETEPGRSESGGSGRQDHPEGEPPGQAKGKDAKH